MDVTYHVSCEECKEQLWSGVVGLQQFLNEHDGHLVRCHEMKLGRTIPIIDFAPPIVKDKLFMECRRR